MGRPRKHNVGLPTGVYLRRGVYYRVTAGKWTRLGSSMDDVERALQEEIVMKPSYVSATESMCSSAFHRAKNNAKGRRQLPFTITKTEVMSLLENSRWRCAVSGLPFSDEVVNGRRPFAPSIDRIDSNLGYESGNCRVVCVLVNLAMNRYGEAALWRVFARKQHRVLEVFRRALDKGS